jgi:hypothetical protein
MVVKADDTQTPQNKPCGCELDIGEYDRTFSSKIDERAVLKHDDGKLYWHTRTIRVYRCVPKNPIISSFVQREYGAWSEDGEKADIKGTLQWTPEGPGLDYKPKPSPSLPSEQLEGKVGTVTATEPRAA